MDNPNSSSNLENTNLQSLQQIEHNSRQNSFHQAINENDFAIPELPSGRVLSFVLLSPWDDPFYMGLSSIEIFTKNGARAEIDKIETDANESFGDLKGLLYCKSCKSTDPRGMWMCKYRHCSQDSTSYGCSITQLPITVKIALKHVDTIAMIRIWNYNESRVHALRGVCRMNIELDDTCIFKGEISCAYSAETDDFPMGDTILFSTSEEILNRIAENDSFLTNSECDYTEKSKDIKGNVVAPLDIQNTKKATENLGEFNAFNIVDKSLKLTTLVDENFVVAPFNISALTEIQRPATGGLLSAANFLNDSTNVFSFDKLETSLNDQSSKFKSESPLNSGKKIEKKLVENTEIDSDKNEDGIYGKVFHMELLANWGAPDLIGLAGVQFLGPKSDPIDVVDCAIRYTCLNSADANSPTLHRLVNGNNLTSSPDEMWVQNWSPTESSPMLSFNFAKDVCLGGVSIWNYNASAELSYCGVKCVQFYVNGRPVCGPVLLRKAPGYVYFDYVQDILFDRCHLFRPLTLRINTRSISAFIFELRLLSSWGDEYYIGLNGVELFNRRNQLVCLRPQNLAAFPESINVLPSMKNDPRCSSKLIDGVNDTKKPYHMWLTPALPNNYARVFFIFDSPVFISRIRIFNYRKTPNRGVRHLVITADDLIIYSGEAPQSDASFTGILDISLRDLD